MAWIPWEAIPSPIGIDDLFLQTSDGQHCRSRPVFRTYGRLLNAGDLGFCLIYAFLDVNMPREQASFEHEQALDPAKVDMVIAAFTIAALERRGAKPRRLQRQREVHLAPARLLPHVNAGLPIL
jgi:hypothetical protein